MIIMGNDRKKALTAILGPDSPNVGIKGEEDAEEGSDGALMAIAEELLECIHSKDATGLVEGLRAIFQEFDASPHVEGEHLE